MLQSIFKKKKSAIWATKELMCPPPSKLSLILPEIAQGDALVVEEVECKNILIVSGALCLLFSSTTASCPGQQGDIITVGKFGLPKQFEI